jgi:hypothetical protein
MNFMMHLVLGLVFISFWQGREACALQFTIHNHRYGYEKEEIKNDASLCSA